MKFNLYILCILSMLTQCINAQKTTKTSNFKSEKFSNEIVTFDKKILLDSKVDTTANVSFSDFDGDGHLDILVVKGRHWPIVDRILLGDGKGGVNKDYLLGLLADRSYTGGVADFNGDGFPDIAISNDAPDKKLLYFNDGKGNFTVGTEFGMPQWPTRNLAVADINKDGLPDLILANRGRANMSSYICLNHGKGQFGNNCLAFANYPSTTITPADFTNDGFIDLVVPHRNGGQSYVYFGGSDHSYSDDRRIRFGPADAAIRTAAIADFNGDKILDIVTIDEKKGTNIYPGQKDQGFGAGIPLTHSKQIPYALTIADLNKDGKMDIITGYIEAPSTVFFNEGNNLSFKTVSFGDASGVVYGFAVGDFNEDGVLDIATGKSDAISVLYFGEVK